MFLFSRTRKSCLSPFFGSGVLLLPRLQKFLAEAGIASRRRCEEFIRAGRVRVNGRVVRQLGARVDPLHDRVEFDGRKVRLENKAYVILYKPRGYVTTADDPQGRRKVTDLVADLPQRLFPVGRLDYDAEGLLLLTNDGELAHRLTHPRFNIPKTYLVTLDGIPRPDVLQKMATGITLDDGPTAPALVHLRRVDNRRALVEMTIREGRNRQVRRMWAAFGMGVLRLKRTRVADLELSGLRPGQHRHLRFEEVRTLREFAQLL